MTDVTQVQDEARARWNSEVAEFREFLPPDHELLFDAAARQVAEQAESPIEEMFGYALLPNYSALLDNEMFYQQYPVDGTSWRLDFLLTAIDPDMVENGRLFTKPSTVAVELDGHEWHEKTKEQAARDKARDRALTALGFTVLRYTGSEVWHDPFTVAKNAYDHSWAAYYRNCLGSAPVVA